VNRFYRNAEKSHSTRRAMSVSNKETAMAKLVGLRRTETHGEFHHLHSFDGGFWDFEFVVPWTKSACNLDAQLMVIGQDWASQDFLEKHNTEQKRACRKLTGQDDWLPTNRRLMILLRKHFELDFVDTYATDVSVFIKPGKMSGNVPMKYLKYCAERYTLPQIDIVRPRMAICLGSKTFNSVRSALQLFPLTFKQACQPSAHTIMSGTEIYGVPHTGGQGLANAGGLDGIEPIWAGLALRFFHLIKSDD
jgi:hypothetical protein